MESLALRSLVYRRLADTGAAPPRDELAALVGDDAEARWLLRQLHDGHMLVLDEHDEIRMALPFAAQPTAHRIIAASGSWWANCAWDSLAVIAALHVDARIDATWIDTSEPVDIAVHDGVMSSTDGFVHFVVPARHWWDDIVET